MHELNDVRFNEALVGIHRHLHLFGPRDATGSFGWSLGVRTHEVSTWANLCLLVHTSQ